MRHIMLEGECQNGRSVSNASTGVPATSSHCSLFWPVKVFFVLFNILNSLIPHCCYSDAHWVTSDLHFAVSS